MSQLNVPLRTVSDGSNLCQLACALMVMEYYGEVMSAEEGEADILHYFAFTLGKNERHTQGMGLWLKSKGYDISFRYRQLDVVDYDTDDLTEKDVIRLQRKLATIPETTENAFRRKKLSLDIMLINAGCRFASKLPDLAYLDEQLAAGVPVICIVSQKGLSTNPADKGNHAIVITGKSGNSYRYNDCQFARPQEIDSTKLLQAWYATGAYTLAVGKKSA